ncbi:mechanosensitive ion channel family protein [Balneola vulgaris]|uniref:mechanosensitive ion channel family protein n=1 Tax=Balneola vulgaris TaxID=287535 RepID=UPI00036968A5|nr:mechanosensitive ion channel domain-containing protein [Balneola vulgaris]
MQADSTATSSTESYSLSDVYDYLAQIFETTLFEVKDTPVTLFSIFIFILFIVGFSFLASSLKKLLNKKVLPRFISDPGLRFTLSRITQYIVLIAGVLVSFQFIGVDLTGLAVIFGFLSVGIGFGLQNVTSNFISGLIVLFERPISIGDRVLVNGIEGDVQEINIRSTTVRSLNNISIIVPNSEFISKDVVNYSYGDPTYRLVLDVGVSYSSDLDLVIKALNEVAEECDRILKTPKHDVHLRSFGDSAWDMKLLVWVANVKDHYSILNELNQAIVRKFREYDIEIPFPQRDLNFRNAMPSSTTEGTQEKSEG